MMIDDKKMDEKLALTISLKYYQLKRESLPNLEVSQLTDYLFKCKWKQERPQTLNAIVTDVMGVDAETLVQYLSNLVIIESRHKGLDEFDDLFGNYNGQ